jgi:RNA:NAD 2'-phosphotransferase (TPT1/KptA family)
MGTSKNSLVIFEAQGITQMTRTLFHMTRELSTFQGTITNKFTR